MAAVRFQSMAPVGDGIVTVGIADVDAFEINLTTGVGQEIKLNGVSSTDIRRLIARLKDSLAVVHLLKKRGMEKMLTKET